MNLLFFVCLFVCFFAIVLITKNCLIIKDLKAMISVFNTDILRKLSCLLIFVLSATKFSLFFIDGVSQFTGSGSYSSVALGGT